ncbi:peptidase S16 [Agarivorans sp. Toyoura001]|uniref:AAA family ATPase n=1 Tax=Agarivorans sp. Toyoura001 TaxID=2283141 RepID=UPI0010E61C96|nr:AAA family ATPase [Agarivorans sp. Toyoura001]GDY25960.1 peptidase S16 [Agarivorans sp. Toyoura001]
MTDLALSIKKLRPSFDLSNIEPCAELQWSNLMPVAKASFDYFLATNFDKSLMICQSPSFLEEQAIIKSLLNNGDARRAAKAYVMLANPEQLNRPLSFEISAQQLTAFNQAIDAFEELLNQDFSAELLATEFAEDMQFLEENNKQSLSSILQKLVDESFETAFVQILERLFRFLQENPENVNCNAYYKAWETNHAAVFCTDFNRVSLFGQLLAPHPNYPYDLNNINFGHLHTSNNSVLVLNAEDVLADPKLWFELKASFKEQTLAWSKVDADKTYLQASDLPLHIKLIISGNAIAVSDLYELDPELSKLSIAETELLSEVSVNADSVNWYLSQLNYELKQLDLPQLSHELYQPVLSFAAKLCEHNALLSLGLNQILKPLKRLNHLGLAHNETGFEQALLTLGNNINSQQRFSDLSYRDGQTHISLSGTQVGQINGLSVIDFNGLGLSFGEPIRITANVFQGDGDFTDVERKSELAGNIHAKSMMIIQGFLTQLFAKEHHFPYSGNVVFEQSYHEIDGDSASLAGALVLLSALSELPIFQHIAVTGSLDQQGNVLAVGGINEKLEGFYRVAKTKGVDTPVAAIIPSANLGQLNLSKDLLDACTDGLFSVFTVETIEQAAKLVFGVPAGDLYEPDSVYGKIFKRVNIDDGEPSLLACLIKRITRLFKL